ncbi:ClpXP protease specificity-enhancing factor [Ectothiorhodospiraceae bacterium 2226]|nr:ClpXP protease specificity-enhancing factor [Ectothiorhodospiraceae bacterium 2226]
MTSTRPYLLRAMYEWLVDNDLTPYVLVDAAATGVSVPPQFVRDGKIVLNLAPAAVHGLHLGNDEVRFGARFSGKAVTVSFPPDAALAIYARENGRGMMFPNDGEDEGEGDGDDGPDGPDGGGTGPGRGRPKLSVVK